MFLLLLVTVIMPNTWVNINSSEPTPMLMELIDSDVNQTKIKFSMDGFHLVPSSDSKRVSYVVKSENGASLLELGYPDLHNYTESIIIPDNAKTTVNVLSYKYQDFEDLFIMPSKGNFSREINPNDVPIQYSDAYKKNEFYPKEITSLGSPYILRDLRGQTVSVNPFQYNPYTKTLRVYTEIELEVVSSGLSTENSIERVGNTVKLSSNYEEIYKEQFLNYENDNRFQYLVDQGNMLIISNDAFLSFMEPFVEWKNKKRYSY